MHRRIILAVTRLLHDRLIRRWDIPQQHLPRFARHVPRVLVLYDTGTIAINFLSCSKVMLPTGCGFHSRVVPVRLGHRICVRALCVWPRAWAHEGLVYLPGQRTCIVWVVVRREVGGLQGSVKMGLLATNSITGTGRETRVISVLISRSGCGNGAILFPARRGGILPFAENETIRLRCRRT